MFTYQHNIFKNYAINKTHEYYLNTSGDDNNNGSKAAPWKTIEHLNSIHLKAGDIVYFGGGQTFNGSIFIDSSEAGTKQNPVIITSYGKANAVINSGNTTAFTISHASNIHISHLNFMGAGRKNGNTREGVFISGTANIIVDSVEISGYQKSGLLIYNSSFVNITHVSAHDNGFAGISVSGTQSKDDCKNIYIGYCKAENNPGDPTNFNNHSGNGIIAGFCRNVIIEYSTATNNGWDMPRIGNGPVGIWCYEADSITIQHCISYRNKTAKGAADGGGYDLDGGTTNSIIQYCLSYQNEGSAFGLFQYAGASNWYNNTVRFCISENDGLVSAAHAGIFVWNSSRDSSQLKKCFVYNNTIYNEQGAAISYEKESEHTEFKFCNNIFVAKDELITGAEMNDVFLADNWWSLQRKFQDDSINNFEKWARLKNKEQLKGNIVGFNINPIFANAGRADITDPLQLISFYNYQLPEKIGFKNKGIDLNNLFGIENGIKNFNQQTISTNGIGACF